MGSGNGGADSKSRNGNGRERVYPTMAIRYGKMGYVGEFSFPPDMQFTGAEKVVVSTDRGIEIGERIPLTCDLCPHSVSRDQMKTYVRNSGGDTYRFQNGRILRQATESDQAEFGHIEGDTVSKMERCREFVQTLGLEMDIIDCEHIFGGERIVFYFMSDHRVDFRELVRNLAHEFQTRIEMKQVGARDEARLLADYESCGRECCCKNFLKSLKPVTMQMAKIQKATLDPSKVSGRCGRLKCCLRFEHEGYEKLDKQLSKVGARVATTAGDGQVVDRQILTQLLKIRTDEGKLIVVGAEALYDRDVLPSKAKSPEPIEDLAPEGTCGGLEASDNEIDSVATKAGENGGDDRLPRSKNSESDGSASNEIVQPQSSCNGDEAKEEMASPDNESEGGERQPGRRPRGKGRRRRRRRPSSRSSGGNDSGGGASQAGGAGG